MPTTSNFGWTTPADTDLVKDGAAAIRTLGNGIDTSFLDLKGGTTGQVLSKASNTDLDFTWTAGGDITEVQAGTGISVASGTGPIPVVTNTVATAFDAAGDLVYGTGADTFTKLSLGTAGQVLKVNSGATAPEWGAAGGGKVLQVVFFEYNAAVSSTSATFATTNVTATITPSAATSKIAIFGQLTAAINHNATGYHGIKLRLVRGATAIEKIGNHLLSVNDVAGLKTGMLNAVYYDSPNTTSATTYKFEFALGGSGTAYINPEGTSTDTSSILLMEIGA